MSIYYAGGRPWVSRTWSTPFSKNVWAVLTASLVVNAFFMWLFEGSAGDEVPPPVAPPPPHTQPCNLPRAAVPANQPASPVACARAPLRGGLLGRKGSREERAETEGCRNEWRCRVMLLAARDTRLLSGGRMALNSAPYLRSSSSTHS